MATHAREAVQSTLQHHNARICANCVAFPRRSSLFCPRRWDRQPYLTLNGVDDGFKDPQGRSIIKANDTQTGNLMLNGYNGVWAIGGCPF